MRRYAPETLAIHAGSEPDPATGALIPPLHMSTTFQLPEFDPGFFRRLAERNAPPFVYARLSNPTAQALEQKLAALEGSEAALVTASGMAAVSAAVLTLLNSGDHMVASEVCYVGSMELLAEHLPRLGIQVSLVDTSELAQVRAALRPNTKVVYVETPANPILRLSDIAALARLAHDAGALLVVDSTFAGPLLQHPLALGADYVVQSCTKFLNGHGDALGGVVLGQEEGIRRIRNEMLVHVGGAISPFNAWLISRGLATLPLRMERHCTNALAVARFLEAHPCVARVIYPGLENHPHHDLALRQMSAFGGVLVFQLKGGVEAVFKLAEKVRLFSYATSLGHVHSLLSCYATDQFLDTITYLSDEQKARIRDEWMGEAFIRASVGLENVHDLITDLDQALD